MDTTWEPLLFWGLRSQLIKAGGTQMVKSKKSNFRKNRNPKGFNPNGAEEVLRCRHYIRYVDDFVLFDNSKMRLNEYRERIVGSLHTLRLKLHPRKCRVFRIAHASHADAYRLRRRILAGVVFQKG
jgi:hypothetical protein